MATTTNSNINQVFGNIKKQITFAAAQALTKTAQDAQKELVQQTKSVFNTRKPWMEKGKYAIRIIPATKAKLTATVWNDAPFMEKQEEGGEREPKRSVFAVPTENVRRNKKDLITKANRPRNLKRTFAVTSKYGNKILIQRTGKGKRSKTRVMYVLEPKARISARWGFADTTKKVVKKRLAENFGVSYRNAIRSAQ